MPDTITINDPADPSVTYSVRIGYKGKAYYCSLCQVQHVGGCEVKKNSYAEKDHRATLTIDQTILADSTLRQADATGLSADIICMSGGRVGHIAHMLQDAPNMTNMKNIIVVAGTNDISKEGESVEEFADIVSKAVGRFQDLAYSTHQALTFVEPPPQPALSSLATRKRDRLNVLMKELSTKENCEFRYLRCPTGIHMDILLRKGQRRCSNIYMTRFPSSATGNVLPPTGCILALTLRTGMAALIVYTIYIWIVITFVLLVSNYVLLIRHY